MAAPSPSGPALSGGFATREATEQKAQQQVADEQLLQQWLLTVPDLEAQFRAMNTSGNGKLSRTELVAAVAPFVGGWPDVARLPDALLSSKEVAGRFQSCMTLTALNDLSRRLLEIKFGSAVRLKLTSEAQLKALHGAVYQQGAFCDGCGHEFGAGKGWSVYHGVDIFVPQTGARTQFFDLCKTCGTNQAKLSMLLTANRPKPQFAGAALMLYPHSGRHGFELLQPDPAVPTPTKSLVVKMLQRETTLRNAAATQQLLDSFVNAKEGTTIALQSSTVTRVRNIDAKNLLGNLPQTATCDRDVFEGIKRQVVEEFGLPPSHIDLLRTAESRFPNDKDISDAAVYLKYNRAVQGSLGPGDKVPAQSIQLASLQTGKLCSLYEHLSEGRDAHLPTAIIAGSIT